MTKLHAPRHSHTLTQAGSHPTPLHTHTHKSQLHERTHKSKIHPYAHNPAHPDIPQPNHRRTTPHIHPCVHDPPTYTINHIHNQPYTHNHTLNLYTPIHMRTHNHKHRTIQHIHPRVHHTPTLKHPISLPHTPTHIPPPALTSQPALTIPTQP